MIRIERFDTRSDAARLRSCFEIMTAGERHDDPGLPAPSFTAFGNRWGDGFAGNPQQAWLAVDAAGQPAGCYRLTLPERENPTMAWCVLVVAPGSRRSGTGTALLRHCIEQARMAGRLRLVCEVKDGSPGAAFAASVGATSGIGEVLRQLDVGSGLPARLAGLRAAAQERAAGYALVSWIGASPPDTLDDQAQLNAAMVDAPTDEGVEPELWDIERITNMEQVCLGSGQQFYAVAARHEATGQLVAITQLRTDPGTPDWAFQMLTAVLSEHRGHRLGLLVKVATLELLTEHEPAVRHVMTGNADSNQHMIAINEQLGFTVTSVHRSWQLDLAAG